MKNTVEVAERLTLKYVGHSSTIFMIAFAFPFSFPSTCSQKNVWLDFQARPPPQNTKRGENKRIFKIPEFLAEQFHNNKGSKMSKNVKLNKKIRQID